MENNKVRNKEDYKNTDNSNNLKKKNKKIWVIISIITIILVIVGIVIYNILTIEYIPMSPYPVREYPGTIVVYKPIIYLYPEKETQISVKLGKKENITCSYPEYKDGWNIIAKPDGKLIDLETNRNLYGLYWEGIQSDNIDTKKGFVVKGSDTIKFLEEKLEILGLNEIEAQEFIIYWLPKMQNNKYNYIRFATLDEINENMPLDFSVRPDTLIRVLMQYKPLEEYMEVEEQELVSSKREGFVVVEWGGTQIK